MTTESQGVLIFAASFRDAHRGHDTFQLRWSARCWARIDEKSEVPGQPSGRERTPLDARVGDLAAPQGRARTGGAEPGVAGAAARPPGPERRGDQPEHLGRLRLAPGRRGMDAVRRVEAVADRAHPRAGAEARDDPRDRARRRAVDRGAPEARWLADGGRRFAGEHRGLPRAPFGPRERPLPGERWADAGGYPRRLDRF